MRYVLLACFIAGCGGSAPKAKPTLTGEAFTYICPEVPCFGDTSASAPVDCQAVAQNVVVAMQGIERSQISSFGEICKVLGGSTLKLSVKSHLGDENSWAATLDVSGPDIYLTNDPFGLGSEMINDLELSWGVYDPQDPYKNWTDNTQFVSAQQTYLMYYDPNIWLKQ